MSVPKEALQFHDQVGRAFYHRGKGDIALSRKDYEAARAAFSLRAGLARSSRHTWSLIYALTALATSDLRLGDFNPARRYLTEAAGLVYHLNKDKGISLIMLRTLAELHAREGDRVRAVELAALVEGHVHFLLERDQGTDPPAPGGAQEITAGNRVQAGP